MCADAVFKKSFLFEPYSLRIVESANVIGVVDLVALPFPSTKPLKMKN